MKSRETAAKKWLGKNSRRGFRGFPAATIACYGPTAERATKIVVAIVRDEHAEPDPLERIIGCPHEEGIDYPEGKSCPQCPYWAGRDRFTHERVH
jgi:hypothetical protein